MKRYSLLTAVTALLLVLGSPAWAQNQHELNQRAEQEYKQADAELNKV